MAITKKASTDREQELPRSKARPMVREWATPSYSAKTGRGNVFGEGGDRQVPSAGRHTTANPLKGRTRPGRW